MSMISACWRMNQVHATTPFDSWKTAGEDVRVAPARSRFTRYPWPIRFWSFVGFIPRIKSMWRGRSWYQGWAIGISGTKVRKATLSVSSSESQFPWHHQFVTKPGSWDIFWVDLVTTKLQRCWHAGKIDKILKEIDEFDRQFGQEQDRNFFPNLWRCVTDYISLGKVSAEIGMKSDWLEDFASVFPWKVLFFSITLGW